MALSQSGASCSATGRRKRLSAASPTDVVIGLGGGGPGPAMLLAGSDGHAGGYTGKQHPPCHGGGRAHQRAGRGYPPPRPTASRSDCRPRPATLAPPGQSLARTSRAAGPNISSRSWCLAMKVAASTWARKGRGAGPSGVRLVQQSARTCGQSRCGAGVKAPCACRRSAWHAEPGPPGPPSTGATNASLAGSSNTTITPGLVQNCPQPSADRAGQGGGQLRALRGQHRGQGT
jgi:hypothetical protein